MQPLVGIIMGSTSDWETMKHACDILDELNVPYKKRSFPLTGRLISCLNMLKLLEKEASR